MDILSAPASSNSDISYTDRIPPPTVKGIKTFLATFVTRSTTLFLDSNVAVISRKTNSSAPSFEYLAANSIGSPSTVRFAKFTPLTTLPFLTSRQGIIRFANTGSTPEG